MGWRKAFVSFFVLLPLLPYCFSQDARPLEEALTASSSLIRERLADLRRQSEDMTLLLEELSSDLAQSRTELTEWQERSRNLSHSLTSISEQLTDSYVTITSYERSLRAKSRIVLVLALLLTAILLIKGIAYALYFRGLAVPRWLDILL